MTTSNTKRLIGGTDISAVMGLNPYRGPRSVYDRIVLGISEPMNGRMARGTREEPRIREMFVAETGAVLAPHPGIVYHSEYEFASVSPDDFATIDGKEYACEYKSVSRWSAKKWGMPGTDGVPDHYSLQVHWSLGVTGKPNAVLYAAFGEDQDDFKTFSISWTAPYFIQRDEEIIQAMFEAGRRFWHEHVIPKIPPPPDKKKSKGKQPARASL